MTSVVIKAKNLVPDSIPNILKFLLVQQKHLTKLQSDPNRDFTPFNQSQFLSMSILFGEAKLGWQLKQIGADRNDKFLPVGVTDSGYRFFIRVAKFEAFIEDAFEQVVFFNTAVKKEEFLSIMPSGNELMATLIEAGLMIGHARSSELIDLPYTKRLDIDHLREVAGSDFEKVLKIFQRPQEEVVTWKNVFEMAERSLTTLKGEI